MSKERGIKDVTVRSDTGDGMLATAGLRAGIGDVDVVLANQGRTAFLQAVGGSLRSVVLNTADGTHLRQEMDVTISIANFGPLRRAAMASLIGSSLSARPPWLR